MNYLAHAYLSFGDIDILTGNMISDFIKGKAQYSFPVQIQHGIRLHRMIDNFTDFHPMTAKAKELFRPQYRLYSGPFVDVVFDHFLALDLIAFEEDGGLEMFTQKVYVSLQANEYIFPDQFKRMFPFMKSQNWLLNYRTKEGIRKALGGVAYRAKYLDESQIAFEIFNQHYDELEDCYSRFFPELKQFSLESLGNLAR
ncbi:MAG: ACP phosphodiesterase [Ginsengibacter sp.]